MPPRKNPNAKPQPKHSDNVKHRIFYQITDGPLVPRNVSGDQDPSLQPRVEELEDTDNEADNLVNTDFFRESGLAPVPAQNEPAPLTGSFNEQMRQLEEYNKRKEEERKRQLEEHKQRHAVQIQNVDPFSDPAFWANLDLSKIPASSNINDPFRVTMPPLEDINYNLQGPGIKNDFFSPELQSSFIDSEADKQLREYVKQEKEKEMEAWKTATAAVTNTPTRSRSQKDTSKQHLPIQKMANTWQIHRRKVSYTKDNQRMIEDEDEDVQMLPPPTPFKKPIQSHARKASASGPTKSTPRKTSNKADDVPPVPPLPNYPPPPMNYRFEYEMPPTPISLTSPDTLVPPPAPVVKPKAKDMQEQYVEWLSNAAGAQNLMDHDKAIRQRVVLHQQDYNKCNGALLKINAILNITELTSPINGVIRARRDYSAGWHVDLHGATKDPSNIKFQALRQRPIVVEKLENIDLSLRVAMRDWNANQKAINASMSGWAQDAIPGSTYLESYGELDSLNTLEMLDQFNNARISSGTQLPTPAPTSSAASMSMSSPVLAPPVTAQPASPAAPAPQMQMQKQQQQQQQQTAETMISASHMSEMVRDIQEMRQFLEKFGMPMRQRMQSQPVQPAATAPTPGPEFVWDFNLGATQNPDTIMDMGDWPLKEQAGMQSPNSNQLSEGRNVLQKADEPKSA